MGCVKPEQWPARVLKSRARPRRPQVQGPARRPVSLCLRAFARAFLSAQTPTPVGRRPNPWPDNPAATSVQTPELIQPPSPSHLSTIPRRWMGHPVQKRETGLPDRITDRWCVHSKVEQGIRRTMDRRRRFAREQNRRSGEQETAGEDSVARVFVQTTYDLLLLYRSCLTCSISIRPDGRIEMEAKGFEPSTFALRTAAAPARDA